MYVVGEKRMRERDLYAHDITCIVPLHAATAQEYAVGRGETHGKTGVAGTNSSTGEVK